VNWPLLKFLLALRAIFSPDHRRDALAIHCGTHDSACIPGAFATGIKIADLRVL
jgi:hypothetical protein